jgi:iron complex outermembrane receptor protein
VLNANGTTTPTLFSQGEPLYTLAAYENAGKILIEGLDVDLLTHFDIGNFGKITTQLNYSHIFEYNASSCYDGQCATVYLAGTHGPSGISGDTGNPQDRAVLTVSWDRGPIDITATVNYVGHYSLNDPSVGETTCADAVADYGGIKFGVTGVYPTQYCTVHHFTDVNLYGSYMINRHFTVFGSIDNLFNTPPPVDIATYGAGELAYNSALAQAGAVGMLFDVGFKYTF